MVGYPEIRQSACILISVVDAGIEPRRRWIGPGLVNSSLDCSIVTDFHVDKYSRAGEMTAANKEHSITHVCKYN